MGDIDNGESLIGLDLRHSQLLSTGANDLLNGVVCRRGAFGVVVIVVRSITVIDSTWKDQEGSMTYCTSLDRLFSPATGS